MNSVEENMIPNTWEIKSLSELCSKITDGSHNPPKSFESSSLMMLSGRNVRDNKLDFEKVRFVSKADFDRENKRTDIKVGDVLLTTVGTIGRCLVYPKDAPKVVFQRSVSVIKPLKEINSTFLCYFLQNPIAQETMMLKSRGAAQKGIYLKDVRSLKIPLPPIEEQKRIVAKIDTLFAEIDKTITLTEKSLVQAKNLLPSVLNEIFEKGKADGWEEKKLGEVFKLTSGKFLPKRKLINGKHKVYGGNGITALHNDYFIEDETIVIGRVGEYCGATHIVDKKSWVTDNGLYCKEFFLDVNLGFLKSILTNMNLNQYAKTSGQPSISQTTVHNLSVPIPSIKRQKEIENYFASMDKLNEQSKSKLKEQLRYLKQLKSSILSKAFKGEL